MNVAQHWGIAAVLAVQFAVVASIPIRAVSTRTSGADVTLWTVPVDPYSVMSGYYVTLSYEAEQADVEPVPTPLERNQPLWVTVRRDEPAWTPVSVTRERPDAVPGEVSLRARWNGHRVELENAGRLYIPETERERADEHVRNAGGRGLVDLKVGTGGDLSVLRLRIDGAVFGEEP
jgi:hypothetical protein